MPAGQQVRDGEFWTEEKKLALLMWNVTGKQPELVCEVERCGHSVGPGDETADQGGLCPTLGCPRLRAAGWSFCLYEAH